MTDNANSFERGLQIFAGTLADPSPALATVADDLREMARDQFATEGAAGGTPWAEAAPSTSHRGAGRGLLYRTGALFFSLTDPGATGHVEELDEDSLVFGSSLPYAMFHQTGTGIGFGQERVPAHPRARRGISGVGRGRALPMRPLLVIGQASAEHSTEIVRGEIELALKVLTDSVLLE